MLDAALVRNSLKLAVAALITAAIAVHFGRIEFLWYPLLAVVIVVDDNDDHTVQAATGRVMGTVLGGLITFLVHTVLSGWAGVLVSLVLMVPALQLLGWQSALGTAGITSIMFLMIPSHVALNWDYVFNRALDTAVGCLVAIAVGLLFWPRNALGEMAEAEGRLRRQLSAQLQRYHDWLERDHTRPGMLDPAPLTSDLQRLEQLLGQERAGPRRQQLRRHHWEQRLRLWQLTHFHWLAWERLLADLPEPQIQAAEPLRRAVLALGQQLLGDPLPTPPRQPQLWRQLAARQQLPLLPLLALAEEWRPLHACLGSLRRIGEP
ncbi:MAG: FUSC family protein [Cyanobium sp.]